MNGQITTEQYSCYRYKQRECRTNCFTCPPRGTKRDECMIVKDWSTESQRVPIEHKLSFMHVHYAKGIAKFITSESESDVTNKTTWTTSWQYSLILRRKAYLLITTLLLFSSSKISHKMIGNIILKKKNNDYFLEESRMWKSVNVDQEVLLSRSFLDKLLPGIVSSIGNDCDDIIESEQNWMLSNSPIINKNTTNYVAHDLRSPKCSHNSQYPVLEIVLLGGSKKFTTIFIPVEFQLISLRFKNYLATF